MHEEHRANLENTRRRKQKQKQKRKPNYKKITEEKGS